MITAILISTLLTTAQAQNLTFTPTEAEKKCGLGVYCIEKMHCAGFISDPIPRGMHPSHYAQSLGLRSLKTTKKLSDGRKVLVDSLLVSQNSAGDKPITIAEVQGKDDLTSGSYGAPARISGKSVTVNWGGGLPTVYKFRIIGSENKGNHRLDFLVGSKSTVGSVVADHAYQYKCEAMIVTAPTRIDDFTRP